MARVYDTIRLPGSARDTRVLVAGDGQTPQRNLIQFFSRPFIKNDNFTRNTNIFNNA
jgi:hypothetical protein